MQNIVFHFYWMWLVHMCENRHTFTGFSCRSTDSRLIPVMLWRISAGGLGSAGNQVMIQSLVLQHRVKGWNESDKTNETTVKSPDKGFNPCSDGLKSSADSGHFASFSHCCRSHTLHISDCRSFLRLWFSCLSFRWWWGCGFVSSCWRTFRPNRFLPKTSICSLQRSTNSSWTSDRKVRSVLNLFYISSDY